MSNLPTVEFLKDNCEKIHYFGLGFVQLKMKNPKIRYHFYNKELSRLTPTEEIHNHRYAFESRILAGELDQIIYNVIKCGPDQATHTLRPVSCDPKKPVPKSADKAIWSTAIPCFVSKIPWVQSTA